MLIQLIEGNCSAVYLIIIIYTINDMYIININIIYNNKVLITIGQ